MTDAIPAMKAEKGILNLGGAWSALNSSLEMFKPQSRRSTFGCVTDKDQKFDVPRIDEIASNMQQEVASTEVQQV